MMVLGPIKSASKFEKLATEANFGTLIMRKHFR